MLQKRTWAWQLLSRVGVTECNFKFAHSLFGNNVNMSFSWASRRWSRPDLVTHLHIETHPKNSWDSLPVSTTNRELPPRTFFPSQWHKEAYTWERATWPDFFSMFSEVFLFDSRITVSLRGGIMNSSPTRNLEARCIRQFGISHGTCPAWLNLSQENKSLHVSITHNKYQYFLSVHRLIWEIVNLNMINPSYLESTPMKLSRK